jgi:3-oxoacyl-[acyl-carrier protein] reductase
MDLGLVGAACLVTGASAGIGRAVALGLAAEGARVALVGRDRERLDAVAAAIAARGGAVAGSIQGDLATAAGVDRVAAEAQRLLGTLAVLVNNAGGSRPLPPEAGDDVWEEAMALNFTAARRLTERLLPAMRAARGGRIVNITGAMLQKRINAATPAKVALQSWSHALAFELAPFGITVNCVAPGRINSDQILKRLYPDEAARATEIAANLPVGRFGEPEELAALVVFLASKQAAYISGAAIPVDGAMYRLDLK